MIRITDTQPLRTARHTFATKIWIKPQGPLKPTNATVNINSGEVAWWYEDAAKVYSTFGENEWGIEFFFIPARELGL